MPASLLFFDTETKTIETPDLFNTQRQSLQFGFAYACRYEAGRKTRECWCRFTTAKEFFAFIKTRTDKDRPLYCFAHNLPFDLTILDFWHWTEDVDFKVEYFVLEDPPSFIIGRWKGAKIVFIDTLNYWRNSLAKIGESIGLPKLTMPSRRASKASWDKYGKRDVEILALAVDRLMRYVKDNDLGQFGLSAASMAMSTFKHRFMKHEIFIHDNRKAMACERAAYYGGYTDCMFVGKVKSSKVFKVDVNSMYPFVMLGSFPVKLLSTDENISISRLQRQMQTFGVVASVTINSKKHTYPCYFQKRLCYVKGLFETTLCGPELKRAIHNGDVVKCHYAAYYQMAPIFKDYINFFWEQRCKAKAAGNEVDQYFVKLFMNMLYGKFGQQGYGSVELTVAAMELIYRVADLDLPNEYKTQESLVRQFEAESSWLPIGLGRPLTLRRINNVVQVKVPIGEHSESFAAIAGYVTSYARELLLSYIAIAGKRNCYYTDTDSLFVNQMGYKNLKERGTISDSAIGKLKLEGVSNGAEFFCPKQYTFDGNETRKGVRRNAIKCGNGVFLQQQFEGVKSVLKRHYDPFIDVRYVFKRVTGTYNKGVIGPDGWVEPFTLNGNESVDAVRTEV